MSDGHFHKNADRERPKYSDKTCPIATSTITYPQWTAEENIPTYVERGRQEISYNHGTLQLYFQFHDV